MSNGFSASKIIIGFVVSAVIIFLAYFLYSNYSEKSIQNIGNGEGVPLSIEEETITEETPLVSVVAQGFEVPWGLVFLPDGGMLVTERKGTVRFESADGKLQDEPVIEITSVKQIGEGGLHGIDLHPDFESNNYVYFYYTYEGDTNSTQNRVVRYKYNNGELRNEEIIIDAIPGASNHDGGRIKFGPDGFLYITTGDAQNPSLAQNTDSLAGKILRVTDEGSSVSGNPFGNEIYSYGHRNPQGIAWDDQGNLWATEHGPSGVWPNCCQDELNFVEIGANYGWPDSVGDNTEEGVVAPVLHSGRNIWAPAGLAYLNDKFYFAGLRGNALYEVDIANGEPKLEVYFKNELGRLREVVAGPDGMLYVTTSNRDGRGIPKAGDDKILRINPGKL